MSLNNRAHIWRAIKVEQSKLQSDSAYILFAVFAPKNEELEN